MRKLLLTLFLFAALYAWSADDVVVLRNQTRMDVTIQEITEREILYKRTGGSDNTVYHLPLNTVSLVITSDGDVTSYADYKDPEPITDNRRSRRKQSGDSTYVREKLHFNPEPSDKRPFGLSVGYISQRYKMSGLPKKKSNLIGNDTYSPGFQAAFLAHPEFRYGIGIKTGLNFEIDYEYENDNTVNFTRMINLSFGVPVQLSYRYEIVKDFSIMFFTGPIFDFGVYAGGAYGAEFYTDNRNLYRKDNYFFGNYKYEGFNCLWGIGAAMQYSGLRFSIGGDFGISRHDISGGGEVYLQRPIYITLGYMFNSKKK